MAEGSGRGEFKPNLGGGRGTAFFVNVHAAVVGELMAGQWLHVCRLHVQHTSI